MMVNSIQETKVNSRFSCLQLIILTGINQTLISNGSYWDISQYNFCNPLSGMESFIIASQSSRTHTLPIWMWWVIILEHENSEIK